MKASESFIEKGYINSVVHIPDSKDELYALFKELSVLICELSITHLLHEIAYKEKYGTLMKNHLEGFQRRLGLAVKEFDENL